jgi:hypothetical protein
VAPPRRSSNKNLLVGLGAVALVVIVVVVVMRSKGGDDASSHQLTVCESAWQEAQRSADETGAQRDNPIVVKPTLTACDTVAEWDAANIRAHSPIGEGAPVVGDICTKLNVTSTRLCMEAEQMAPAPNP